MSATANSSSRIRQLRLFDAENPLGARVGAAFFRSLPPVPGVYFFHAADGALLAQSLTDSRITFMQATPASWRLLLEAGWVVALLIACRVAFARGVRRYAAFGG